MKVGDSIKYWRELRGMKQSELAEKLNVSDKTVSSWEVNRTEPKMGMVQCICRVLNCNVSDLIGTKEMKKDLGVDYMVKFLTANPEYVELMIEVTKVTPKDLRIVGEILQKFAQ